MRDHNLFALVYFIIYTLLMCCYRWRN